MAYEIGLCQLLLCARLARMESRPMTMLSKETVAQRVTPGRIRWFRKEVHAVRGPEPIAVVRKRRAEGETLAPVVLVHGFGQNRYAWHMSNRSFANYLADRGFDVFNVDLRGHGRSKKLGSAQSRGIDDYIRGDVPAVLDEVLSLSGFAKAFFVGHSLGGLCAAAASARRPDKVAGVVTIGSPHALGRGHFVLGNGLRLLGHTVGSVGMFRGSQRRFRVDLIGKAVHATRFAFDSRFAPIPVRGWKPGAFEDGELANYLRSFDAESFSTVDDMILLAMTGELRSRIDGTSYTRLIEHSELPLLALSGASDLLANPGAVKPLFERSRARDKQYIKVDAGHGDLLVGRQAPDEVWPVVGNWLWARREAVLTHRLAKPALLAG
ncbi:MAG TPA: alpha/beta hydrolase [Polyangiaceae bacterium]|nr:alpha/beta hydrolase [Polyangiaceae bacterium]